MPPRNGGMLSWHRSTESRTPAPFSISSAPRPSEPLAARSSNGLGRPCSEPRCSTSSPDKREKAMPENDATVVLLHGAFAESASWNGVIDRLHGRSLRVVAVANPLRSLAGDAQYVRDVIAGI